MLNYRDRVYISKHCVLIIGRHLDLVSKQADVANAIVYKKNKVLYIIDTGAMLDFRESILSCCADLEPYNQVILINTHGHGDHAANNILIEELAADHKQHFISVFDMDMLLDNQAFFEISFNRLANLMTDDITTHERVANLLSLFKPLDVKTPYLSPLQARDMSDIIIGNIHWSGWNFNESIYVLRTEGHSAGHVIIYFPELKHLHMADETNGYCNLFHDCDHLKSLESHTKSLSMLNEKTVETLSDGHTFKLYCHAEATHYLQNLIDSHYCYANAVRDILFHSEKQLTFKELENQISIHPQLQHLSKGVNPNPMYEKLMLLSKLRDFGIKYENIFARE